MKKGCTPPHTAGKSFCHIGSVLKFLDFVISKFRDLLIMRNSKEISKSLNLKIRNYYLYYTILYHYKYKVIFKWPKYLGDYYLMGTITGLSRKILSGAIDKNVPVLVDVFDRVVVFRNDVAEPVENAR